VFGFQQVFAIVRFAYWWWSHNCSVSPRR